MQVSIRRARSGDEDALALVGQATFLETFSGILDGVAIMGHCRIKLLTFDTEDKPRKSEIALDRLKGLVADKYRLLIGRPDVSHQQVSLVLVGGRVGQEAAGRE